MSRLVLLRHGQSMWNFANVFTGWVDVPLSSHGIEEALLAGERLADIDFQAIYVSTLDRAIATAMLAMSKTRTGKTPVVMHPEDEKQQAWATIYDKKMVEKIIPVYRSWTLNERYYGELQGKNKKMLADEVGAEQVQKWRRSYQVKPPAGECLKDTAERTLPYFKTEILPALEKGNVLVAAHGNSLRAIVMHLDKISPEMVEKLEIPTGIPLIYRFENGQLVRETSE